MKYCYNCGYELADNMNYCPNCGCDLTNSSNAVVATTDAVTTTTNTVLTDDSVFDLNKDYSIVLADLGTCAKSYADDLLEDILGYSDYQAMRLIRNIPCKVATNLTEKQALYIAQALNEYGLEIMIYRNDECIDIDDYATGSIFDSNGDYLPVVATVLAAIGAANHVKNIIKWSLIDRYKIFAPRRYAPRRPAIHKRRRPADVHTGFHFNLFNPQPKHEPVHEQPHQQPRQQSHTASKPAQQRKESSLRPSQSKSQGGSSMRKSGGNSMPRSGGMNGGPKGGRGH